MNRDTQQQIARIDLAGRQERLAGGEMVQTQRAVRYPSAGIAIHTAYCKADAGASDEIICYLDTDETGEEWVVSHVYSENDKVIGTNNEIYKYTGPADYTSTVDDQPTTGVNYKDYWTQVAEITVKCIIFGGEYLNAAYPQLTDGQPIEVYKEGSIWYSVWPYYAWVGCETYEEE